MEIVFLILGLIGLWVGSEYVVKACKAIARRFGISELLIGITVVSIGTSLPEIMVTSFSGARGVSDVAIGTMIGSCLAQITIILGISGMVHDVHSQKKAMQVDGPMMLVAILIFGMMLYSGGELTRFEGILMIWIYISYIWFTAHNDVICENKRLLGVHTAGDKPAIFRIGQLFIGMTILLGSAHFVLESATTIARAHGLSESFIGVMIIGVASCLPELSTAIVGMWKNAPSIAVGTLIGSNITDPLLSTGIGSLFNGFETDMDLLRFDLPFWFLSSCIALILLNMRGETLHKSQAAILIAIYGVFILFKLDVMPIPEWMYLF
ncbi:MAG: sodium:calcium antiporter [Candidatus Peregrinibacteria bacterium]|nr:sodium:calcium antiporter [Candidatus Peregrinibacteria bacterium]MDZ4244437.1 sodium:calcium antiporter [Candidatus Gracilibacteria bacterium]